MRLVTGLAIDNFRSIRRLHIADTDAYTPIIGLNSTGKSNILRALNLFFNGYLDEARTPLELERDYPDALKKSGKRQKVAVAVTFDTTAVLPRGAASYVEKHRFQTSIAIERAWTRVGQTDVLADTVRAGADLNSLEVVKEDELQTVLSFVRSVRYRYVPNHLRPADVIRDEIQVLRPSLVTNLSRTTEFKQGGVSEALEALSRVAGGMLEKTSHRIADGSGREVAVDVPADFADLAFQIVLQTVTNSGGLQATDLQGSGTQSFTLLHVLDLLDRTERGRSFGWIKGHIWALEEPESFLHAGLRARFAHDLFEYSNESSRQVFLTTHQDEFVRVAENAYVAKLNNDNTTLSKENTRSALAETTRLRITTFQHPLMDSADEPLVLVEGKHDSVYLRAAMLSLGLRPRWRLASLADIDPDSQAGGSGVGTYLKANRLVLKSRAITAPVVLLRDWEDQNYQKFSDAVKVHETSTVLRCPEMLTNPDLDATFVGIERYLPTDVIRSIVPSAALTRPADTELPIGLRSRAKYAAIKTDLAKVVRDDLVPPGPYLEGLVKWLDQQVTAVLYQVPVQDFLA